MPSNASLAAGVDPIITPAPELAIRQAPISTDPAFQGYYVKDITSTETIKCQPLNTWTTWSSYGQCCRPGDPCTFITACISNSLFDNQGSRGGCQTGWGCGTITIYSQSPPTQGMSVLRIPCINNWNAFTIYRSIPITTTTTSTTRTSTATTSAITTSTTTIPTSKSIATPPKNDAWIAGAVVGPTVGVAIIAGLLFWIFKLKRQRPISGMASGSSGEHFQYGDPGLAGQNMSHNGMEAASPMHLSVNTMPSGYVADSHPPTL
ncbi:MAG: hypothetical protein M1813_000615 [Trichoglossum hirsutum]|nr:MAG: hypothetical protein M1813_000615 [Trichoglossum hirsutum]